jgi:beta-glucanase (GH16 family)
LDPNPANWGLDQGPEADDALHKPDPEDDKKPNGTLLTKRGLLNIGCLVLLLLTLVGAFGIYPIIQHFQQKLEEENRAALFPTRAPLKEMPGRFTPIDPDTPKELYTRKGLDNPNEEYELVFSDEFNTEGRSFYKGDDPYWEGEDLWYWQTANLEWYDPKALTTENGNLKITIDRVDPGTNHDRNYTGGLMSTWNKFCFTGGYIETKVMLPGDPTVTGMWPAIWTLGNLGRVGYGASLDGMWPYAYDTCDLGTYPNQTYADGSGPEAALTSGDDKYGHHLSVLPGQKLSRCTCKDSDDHPGPKHDDGSWVGRSAPEIDVFEAQVGQDPHPHIGGVSQSLQLAPFNSFYTYDTETHTTVYDANLTIHNDYKGGAIQQAASAVTTTNQDCYERTGKCFSVYGFEYKPGVEGAYITWISDGKPAWTVRGEALGGDPASGISQRRIPEEPMYLIANLGMSYGFGPVDETQALPNHMLVDYIRVYQPKGATNIGCDPPGFPTAAYIEKHIKAYTDPQLQKWSQIPGHTYPGNEGLGQCSA